MDFYQPKPTWLQLLLSIKSAFSRKQHWVSDMAPCHLPSGGLITLNHFHHERSSVLFIMEWALILDIDSQNYHPWNSIAVVFHNTFFLIKGVSSYQIKCSNPMHVEFTGLAMFPSILKQVVWCKGGTAFSGLNYYIDILHTIDLFLWRILTKTLSHNINTRTETYIAPMNLKLKLIWFKSLKSTYNYVNESEKEIMSIRTWRGCRTSDVVF
jgi:hypothetical protein